MIVINIVLAENWGDQLASPSQSTRCKQQRCLLRGFRSWIRYYLS